MGSHDIRHLLIEDIDCIIEEEFYSKKNEVYKARNSSSEIEGNSIVVIKKYLGCSVKQKKEIGLLQHLRKRGLTVPKVYLQKENYMVMEYIEGKTLLEEIEERE